MATPDEELPAPAAPPPAAIPAPDLDAMMQQLQAASPQAVPKAADVDTDSTTPTSFIGLLGERLAGGPPVDVQMSKAQREAAGRRALLSFGAGMASVGPFDSLGQGMAAGVKNAQASQYGAEGLQAERQLGAQTWQQQQFANRLEALKSALPMLKLQIGASLPNMLGTGNAGVVAGKTPGGQISPNSYEGAIAGTEGTGANPRSSATGTGQFIDSTWRDFAKANPDLFQGMTDEQVMAARKDPAIGARAITWLAQQNAAALSKQGVAPTGQSLGIAHYLGADGAAGVMNGADGDKVSSFVGADAVKANPELADMTVGQLKKRYAATPDPAFLKPAAPAQGTQYAGPGVPAAAATPQPAAAATPQAQPPAAATTAPAQATPQAPQQPDAGVPDEDLNWDQFRTRHAAVPTPAEEQSFTIRTDPRAEANAASAVADARKAQAQAAQNVAQANRSLPGDVDKANTEYINATKQATDAQQNYNQLVQDAAKATATNRQAWQEAHDKQLPVLFNAAQDRKNQLKIEQAKAGYTAQQKQADQDMSEGNVVLKAADTAASSAAEANTMLTQLGANLDGKLPSGLAAQFMTDHPDITNFMKTAGFISGDQVDRVQLINGLNAFMSTRLRQAGSGQLRNLEMAKFQGVLPTWLETPAGQKKAIAFLMNMNDRTINEADYTHEQFRRPLTDASGKQLIDPQSGRPMQAYSIPSNFYRNMENPATVDAQGNRTGGGLGAVLPHYSGPMPSNPNDTAEYDHWLQTQVKPGRPYYGLKWDAKNNRPTEVLDVKPGRLGG